MDTATAKAATSFDIPGVQRLCEPATDRATGGRYWLGKTTVGGYLELLGVYKPKAGQLAWNPEVSVPGLQRALIRADKNAIKQAMFRDVLTGAILPPVTLYVEPGSDGSIVVWVLDGSQRTHVLFLDALIAQNMKNILANYDWMQGELEKLKAQGKEALSFDELMAQPVFLQIWSDFVSPSHIVRLFLLLNAGQQKVSSRHLLEVLGRQLQGMFDQWGIPWITERAQKEGARLRSVKGGSRRFGYNFLLTGLVAYLKGDQHIKTEMILTDRSDAGNFDLDLDDKIQAAGDETCRRDFIWACLELNRAIADQYDNDRAQNLIWSTDTFFVPLMAAIGKARQRGYSVDEHQAALLEFMKKAKTGDPLVLGRSVPEDDEDDHKPDPRALFTILDNLTSNIGKYTRNIIYRAFLQFFRQGIEAKTYPVDWEIGNED